MGMIEKMTDEGKQIEYGKTLIEIAKGMGKVPFCGHVLGCATGAAGGMREMKKRMKMIVDRPRTKLVTALMLAAICAGIVGCTFGGVVSGEEDPVQGKEPVQEESQVQEAAQKPGSGQIVPDLVQEAAQGDVETAGSGTDLPGPGNEGGSSSAGQVVLYGQPREDQVCIRVQPSALRDESDSFYIPEGKDQEWLQDFINKMPTEGKPYAKRWEGMKEAGWQIYYKGRQFTVFEGGYVYYTYTDEDNGEMEYFEEAPKLCDYIQILLVETLGYAALV